MAKNWTSAIYEHVLKEIDYKILDMLRRHCSYDEIADKLGVKWTHINRLHRKHFPEVA